MTEDTTCPDNGQPRTFAEAFSDAAREVDAMRETAKREIFPMLWRRGVDISPDDHEVVLSFLDAFGVYPSAVNGIVAGIVLLQEAATDCLDFSRLLRSHGNRFVTHATYADAFKWTESDGNAVLDTLLRNDCGLAEGGKNG